MAGELSRRLSKLFLKGEDGQRPVLKYHPKLATDPHFKDYVLFHEYFHGDTGPWRRRIASHRPDRPRGEIASTAKEGAGFHQSWGRFNDKGA